MSVRTAPHPARRADLEELFERRGLDWEFHEGIPLEDFDSDASLRNQVRMHAILEPVVERYRAAWIRGDTFPAVIAYHQGNHLVRADGNQRAEALARATRALEAKHEDEEGWEPTLATYLLKDATPEVALVVGFEANALHGQPPSDEERYHQAIQLVESGATTQETAAALTGLTRAQVATAVARHQAKRRARRLRLKGWERIPIASLQRMNSVTTDAGFQAIVQLAIDASLGGQDISRLVTAMGKETSEHGQVAIVQAEAQTLAPRIAATARGTLRPRTDNTHVALYRHLGGVRKLTPERLLADVKTGEDRALAAKQCDEVAEQLMNMAEALRKGEAG